MKLVFQLIKEGKVLAHPTETCYGLTCDALNKKAVVRLYRLKQMKKEKPVSLMVKDLAQAKRYGKFSKLALLLAKKYWPGPLTIIVERRESLPNFVNPKNNTVGFRCPKHRVSQNLIVESGTLLTTTSANPSGLPAPYSAATIKKQYKKGDLHLPDYIIDEGRIRTELPSTIIDLSTKEPKIIRQGSLDLTRFLKKYGSQTRKRRP